MATSGEDLRGQMGGLLSACAAGESFERRRLLFGVGRKDGGISGNSLCGSGGLSAQVLNVFDTQHWSHLDRLIDLI
jgi:hypothetical protein